jgi:hypothetical protein
MFCEGKFRITCDMFADFCLMNACDLWLGCGDQIWWVLIKDRLNVCCQNFWSQLFPLGAEFSKGAEVSSTSFRV